MNTEEIPEKIATIDDQLVQLFRETASLREAIDQLTKRVAINEHDRPIVTGELRKKSDKADFQSRLEAMVREVVARKREWLANPALVKQCNWFLSLLDQTFGGIPPRDKVPSDIDNIRKVDGYAGLDIPDTARGDSTIKLPSNYPYDPESPNFLRRRME